LLRRIKASGLDEKGQPLNIKGICASAATKRFYVTTTRTLTCFDLVTEKILWEKAYDKGCDRMSIAPDGKFIYVTSLENDHWHVVDGLTGEVIEKVIRKSGAQNTIVELDSEHAYLAGLKSAILRVTDTSNREHRAARRTRLGHFQSRWPLCLSIHRRCH